MARARSSPPSPWTRPQATWPSPGTTRATPATVLPPANQLADEGASKSFDLGSFTDSANGPWTGTVNWGDGTTSPLVIGGTGPLGSQAHTYSEEGGYTVTVTVTDTGHGLSGSSTSQVTVSDPAVVPSSPFLFIA